MADPAAAPASYWPVQGLKRGLALLCALNRCPAGTAGAAELARATGLHRTTVKRLLESLREAGFVRPVAEGFAYRLTFRVRELSAGFLEDAWVSEVARPALRALTQRVLWPSDLVTLEGDELVVRESTHPVSPLSFRPGAFGARLPLLRTAVGRAWLAFCPEAEREALLMLVASRDDEQGAEARDQPAVRRLLEATRRRGYAVSRGAELPNDNRFGAIAVPVRRGDAVVACINIVFLLRAASAQKIAEQWLADLQETAAVIEGAIA